MTALADLAHEPLRPVLDPRVWVEPRDADDAPELDRQAAFVAAMRKVAPRCEVVAIPNGTNIASRAGRAKVRREGLATGACDTVVLWTGAVAFIEWKAGRGSLSAAQVEFLNRRARMEHPAMVARTAAGAMQWLSAIGAPVPVIAAGVVARVARGESA